MSAIVPNSFGSIIKFLNFCVYFLHRETIIRFHPANLLFVYPEVIHSRHCVVEDDGEGHCLINLFRFCIFVYDFSCDRNFV